MPQTQQPANHAIKVGTDLGALLGAALAEKAERDSAQAKLDFAQSDDGKRLAEIWAVA